MVIFFHRFAHFISCLLMAVYYFFVSTFSEECYFALLFRCGSFPLCEHNVCPSWDNYKLLARLFIDMKSQICGE